ncbi:endo-1,4-beta-xylanase [Patescibacteria group bacterium]|nr:endo-1,4-beta-xylanase [Patescibacteria group bacterium]MCL5797610.1 endo-1,4-beta-xylanase [Patescibacteria group bacterium]
MVNHKSSKGFIPLLILFVAGLTAIGIGIGAYMKTHEETFAQIEQKVGIRTSNSSKTSSSNKSILSLQELRNELTSQVKQCILKKLGMTESENLVKEVQQNGGLTPDVWDKIKLCFPNGNNMPLPPGYISIPTGEGLSNTNNSNIAYTNGITFGTGVMIQDLPQFCSEIQHYGSHFNWLTLSWQRLEPQKDVWSWSQFDNWVDSFRNCGQQVAVHILSDAPWATQPVPTASTNSRHKPSMPAVSSDDYYNFVYQVASHYKGKIKRYSIENEAHASQNWGGTPEEYFTQLQTAYKAIHAADPDAIVEDAAMSHEGLGYLTAIWLYQQGKTQEAMNFAKSYDEHFQRNSQSLHITNLSQFQTLVDDPGIQKLLQWENLLFQNHNWYDHMQIHNGAPWQDLAIVLDYIHTNLKAQNDDKPLDLWEGWYSWWGAPGNGFDPNTQAQDLTKQMIVALGGNVTVYNYWLFDDFALESEGHVGLVDSQNNPRPAATAYKITSEKLYGTTFSQSLNLGNNVYGYEFTKNDKNIYVVWSTGSTTINLPLNKSSATETDINGNSTLVDPQEIQISTSPVFIQ